MKISIDTGKSQTKVSYHDHGEVQNFMFLSNVALDAKVNPTTDEAEKVVINFGNSKGDKTYLVGEYGVNTYNANSQDISKENDVHKVLVLTSIAKVLEKVRRPDVLTVDIAVNMPLLLFKQSGKAESMQNFYQNNDRHYEVTLNGVKYSFKIGKVVTYFEGIGSVLLERNKYKENEVLSVDLGSFNIGYATFSKAKPVGVLSGSFNEGITKLMTDIEDILIENNMTYLTKDNQHDIIRGLHSVEDHVEAAISAACTEHLRNIKLKLVERSINISLPILASGGGAILLEKYLKETFKNIEVVKNSLFSNSDAGLKLLK